MTLDKQTGLSCYLVQFTHKIQRITEVCSRNIDSLPEIGSNRRLQLNRGLQSNQLNEKILEVKTANGSK